MKASQMLLETNDVREALEEYINRHLRPEHVVKVVKWEADEEISRNESGRLRLMLEPQDVKP